MLQPEELEQLLKRLDEFASSEKGEHKCLQVAVIATLVSQMSGLTGWQKAQNGSIKSVEKKIDKLIFYAMTTAIGFSLSVILAAVILVLKLT
jgi:hypothetical protein